MPGLYLVLVLVHEGKRLIQVRNEDNTANPTPAEEKQRGKNTDEAYDVSVPAWQAIIDALKAVEADSSQSQQARDNAAAQREAAEELRDKAKDEQDKAKKAKEKKCV